MTNYSLLDLANLGNSLVYYTDSTGATRFDYFCMPSRPELSKSDKWWRVMRIEKDKVSDEFIQWKCIMFAGGTPSFEYVATDLATVKLFSYS